MGKWTTDQMPDLHGRVALVTGANSGLGYATAQALAQKGAHVVISCRSAEKGAAAMAQIRAQTAQADLSFLALDLANLASVRAAAQTFKKTYSQLDLLINNAGIMGVPQSTTVDGFETQFGTNHLGHFALNGLLMDRIMATAQARVVTVASIAANSGTLPMDDLNWQRRKYSRGGAYAQAKLANLVYGLELQRRLQAAGSSAISVMAHPGIAATAVAMSRDENLSLPRRFWKLLAQINNVTLAQPAALGALPTLYAATAADLRGGDYIGPRGLMQIRGYPKHVRPRSLAQKATLGAALWQASEQLTGVSFLS
ncbi:oxidoreductase [Sinimarinibacterium sp. NLF-5-8]|uniref:oxidoreductase n=1 Tax=Sinimarinibacterium sp. NLF-5-8 TaxID=2698684 RepID=UPI00137C2B4A|nr:oxidoreductase [Sinimarinibacterium sp. NLF-5-8]QHS11339.1 SDR family NAD(P)-dependent oxidoreductase [Sinimarinibacterium sp. NLF-5-8]